MTYAGQALLHAAIASLVIEALLRLWRVDEPGERLALRWVALLGPVVLTAGYLALVPGRSTAGFTERWALFSGAHWNELRMGGVGVASGATVILSVVGIALYLRDVVPFLAERVSREARDTGLPADHPAVVRVRESLAGLPGSGPGRPATVTVVDLESPVLLCAGVDRTSILVSTGTLARLDDGELTAALAHEVSHLVSRDPLMGWWLMMARTLQFFNPVVQIVARQVVQDVERRADLAVARQGRSRDLAGAVLRLSQAPEVHSDLALPSEGRHFAARIVSSAHRHATDNRSQLLFENVQPASSPLRNWRIGLAGAAVMLLLYLVV
jgi:Zn-dependent protease with chaperone function